jgi:hypothetical protein
VIFKFLAKLNRTIGMSPLPIDRARGRLPQHVRTPTLTASTPIRRWWDFQCPGYIGFPRLLLLVLANLSAASAASGSSGRAFRARNMSRHMRAACTSQADVAALAKLNVGTVASYLTNA